MPFENLLTNLMQTFCKLSLQTCSQNRLCKLLRQSIHDPCFNRGKVAIIGLVDPRALLHVLRRRLRHAGDQPRHERQQQHNLAARADDDEDDETESNCGCMQVRCYVGAME